MSGRLGDRKSLSFRYQIREGHCNICRNKSKMKYCQMCRATAQNDPSRGGKGMSDYLRLLAYKSNPDFLHGEDLRIACFTALEKWQHIFSGTLIEN